MDDRERLLRTLEELSSEELRTFTYYLGSSIPRGKLGPVSAVRLAELILQYHPERPLGLAAEVLEKIPRRDLRPMLRGESGMAEAGLVRMEEDPPAFAPAPVPSKRVSDSELMKLARKLGKRWRQIGIEFLGVENSSLEQIEEDNSNNVVMKAFYMLKDWRNREKERATSARLYHILDQEEVQLDHSDYAFLLEST